MGGNRGGLHDRYPMCPAPPGRAGRSPNKGAQAHTTCETQPYSQAVAPSARACHTGPTWKETHLSLKMSESLQVICSVLSLVAPKQSREAGEEAGKRRR